ncbi:MAG: phosphopentomutase [Gammaproteobacteria bacterium]
MARAIILVLDSLGIGGAPDASAYGDQGANTLGHIAAACAAGQCDLPGQRRGALQLPNFARLGMGAAAATATGEVPAGLENSSIIQAAYGSAIETSKGKDTPSGHWEIAGVPVLFDWYYFPKTIPCFPAELTGYLIQEMALPGFLGECHASGTEIIAQLGTAHVQTGCPIIYTSADSVVQIAAHETSFGLQNLYSLCECTRARLDQLELNVGRVIARPFVGTGPADFRRTGNRRDYAVPPPAPTLLDYLTAAGHTVMAIGKIADIFAHQGISHSIKADGNQALFEATMTALAQAPDGALIFTNFVDFDMLYGHRRDIAGYALALEQLDARLPELEQCLQTDDLVIVSADHGNDPSWPGTDHTREQVPVLAFGPGIQAGPLGQRQSFADIGQTVAHHLSLPPLPRGTEMLN